MARPYAYASAPDVAAHMSFFQPGNVPAATFLASSIPNATQVHQFLNDTADELDARLAKLDYTVPVATGATRSFEVLNSWNSVGAAVHAVAAFAQGRDSKHLEFLQERWKAIIKDLDSEKATLVDAAKDTTLALPRFAERQATNLQASPYFNRELEGTE